MSNPLTEYCDQWQREARATMYEPLEAQRARLEAQQARMQADADRVNALIAERAQARRMGVAPAASAATPAPTRPLSPLAQQHERLMRWAAYRQSSECHANYREVAEPPTWFV
jgi:hypothetical protein